MIIIGHRGSPKNAPENSLESIRYAFFEGAHRCEIDLQLSKDQRIFICHDDTTARTAYPSIIISESSFQNIKNAHLENGEAIPTIEDVCNLLSALQTSSPQNLSLHCEIKTQNIQIISALEQTMQQYPQLVQHMIFSSFHTSCLHALSKSSLSNMPRALCLHPISKLHNHRAGHSNIIQQIRSMIDISQTHILHPHAATWNQELAIWANAEGLDVYTWSALYDEEDHHLWKRLVSYNVSGHCTNIPLAFHRFLNKRS